MNHDQFNFLTGRQNPPLVLVHDQVYVQPLVHQAFSALQAQAKKAGIDLQIASGHRTYARQLLIWNEKVLGKRMVRDLQGHPLHPQDYPPEELMSSILRWSALPGASRHHWGTDLDVYDAAALDQAELQLTVEEAQTTFGQLHAWLDEYLPASEFFRPYQKLRQGVAPEPWHLSFAPLAEQYQAQYTWEIFVENLRQAPDLLLREHVLAQGPQIFAHHLQDIARPSRLA
jgi:LAS superfamily LD-carboxypeptidase LdcB